MITTDWCEVAESSTSFGVRNWETGDYTTMARPPRLIDGDTGHGDAWSIEGEKSSPASPLDETGQIFPDVQCRHTMAAGTDHGHGGGRLF